MTAAPHILARTMKEAHEFAESVLELPYGRYRIVNTPSTVKSLRGVDLHLVPGWQNRFDRFAMQGALKWTRMNVIDVAEQAEVPAPETAVADAEVSNDEAHDFIVTDLDQVAIEATDPVTKQAEAPAADGKQRRRRRCNDCGVLHFKDEACASVED